MEKIELSITYSVDELKKAIAAGFGYLPATWAIKLYRIRN